MKKRKNIVKKSIVIVSLFMLSAGLMGIAYAQSKGGSDFSLNSPASFPVDI